MSETSDEYLALATPIALLIWGRCVDYGDGRAIFAHLNENRFDVHADILARLGVMLPFANDPGAHVFIGDWQPGAGIPKPRHDGAPSTFELIAALTSLINWDQRQVPAETNLITEQPALPDLTDQRRFLGDRQKRFDAYAAGRGASVLRNLGLGDWAITGQFKLIEPFNGLEMSDLVDSYYSTRAVIAKKVGGEAHLYP